MRLQFFIALRYLFSKKKNNVINWITWISSFVVLIVTAALVIILSVMNGLSISVEKLYSNFDPDLEVKVIKGKRFHEKDFPLEAIKKIDGVNVVVPSIEETVLLKYQDNQEVASIKGVTDEFDVMTGISNHIEGESFYLRGGGREFAIVGLDIALKLAINPEMPHLLGIHVPKLEKTGGFGDDFFNSIHPKPNDVFSLNADFNSKYVLISRPFAAELLGLTDEVDAMEIDVKDGYSNDEIKLKVQEIVGPKFQVLTRFEQNEFLFKSISAEKWITLMILSLVILLAIFNVIGSLTMLIIDKQRDIFVLKSLGTTVRGLRLIFWLEGILMSLVGSVGGILIGVLACFLQEQFCLITFGTLTAECFPVQMKISDILIIFGIVNSIAFLGSLIPVFRIKR